MQLFPKRSVSSSPRQAFSPENKNRCTLKQSKVFRMLVVLTLLCVVTAKAEADVYVSPAGNNAWTGQLPDPNSNGTDGPVATIERARDIVSALGYSSGKNIILRGGEYYLKRTINLSSLNSGTPGNPLVIRAYPGERPRLMGGKLLTGFTPVQDQTVSTRLPEEHLDRILRINLPEQGITQIPPMTSGGPVMELFLNGERMRLARYPNEGWLTIWSIPITGETLYENGHYGKITCFTNRWNDWATVPDIWMHGYWYHDWSDSYQEVDRIDTATRTIYMKPPFHSHGYKINQHFYFLNVLEELDSPGEWYLDRQTGELYLYPSVADGEVFLSMLREPLITLSRADNVRIIGLEFTGGSSGAVTGINCSGLFIAGCRFSAFRSEPVTIDGGQENGIVGCDFYNLGSGGVILSGGNRTTLTPAGHYVDNCHFHHYGEINATYRPAVKLKGVGNRVSRSHFHDAPHFAIQFEGNDHLIEGNEIHAVCRETQDAGGIYTGRNWTWRGTVIRNNFFYDIYGIGDTGARAVYLDDAASGITVSGNIFHDVQYGVFIGGGRDNIVDNNIFVDCFQANIMFDARGIGWASDLISPTGSWNMYNKLDEVKHTQPPFSTRYPALARILDEAPAEPRGNVVSRSIHSGSKNSAVQYFGEIPPGMPAIPEEWKVEKSVFQSAERMDFRMRPGAAALEGGFEPIPYDRIGLYRDEYRTEAPSNLPTGIDEESRPMLFRLQAAFPNPFNAFTVLSFQLQEEELVTLDVFSITGQRIVRLVNSRLSAGFHSVRWDGREHSGRSVASGVYLVRLTAGRASASVRVTMLK